MKNKKGFISLVLLLILSLSMVTANAGELDTRPARNPENQNLTFEERIDARIDAIQLKMDEFLAKRTSKYEELVAKGLEASTKKLTLITEFAPELITDFEQAYDNHFEVHQLLFESTYSKQEAYSIEIIAGLETLKTEVLLAVEAETMTAKEASLILKDYLIAKQEEFKAIKDAYKAEIEPLKEVNQANKLIVQELKAELRIAAEAGDTEAITDILTELLTWGEVHLDFDYAKLAILDTY